MEVSVEFANHQKQGVVDFLAIGSQNATAELYEDSTLLVTVTLVEPFGTISDGLLIITATNEALIGATGVANRCVFRNGAGTPGWACTVSDLEGDGEVKLESTTLYAGGYTRIIGGVLA